MGKTAIDDRFEVTREMKDWAEREVPTVNIERATRRWVDYWKENGRMMHDWTACWRNGMRRCVDWGRDLYTADEVRINRLMAEYGSKGFRRAYRHENSVMYETAYLAFDMARNQGPKRDVTGLVTSITQGKRA